MLLGGGYGMNDAMRVSRYVVLVIPLLVYFMGACASDDHLSHAVCDVASGYCALTEHEP